MSIESQLRLIEQEIRDAEKRAGRPENSAKLVAVSKTFPAEDVKECYDAGQRIFGENKVQEALGKKEVLPADIDWHLIGPLQRNKVRKALGNFSLIHSVDSMRLAETMDRVAGEMGLVQRILLEVNLGLEESKFGFEEDTVKHGWEELASFRNLKIEGLMCIPPFTDNPEDSRPYFQRLAQLKADLENTYSISLPELSMGMSHDFRLAIEEGATLVRVGSLLFGNRSYH